MTDRPQLEPGLSQKLRVESRHLKDERDFVRDSLPRAVVAGKKFEIAQVIEGAISIAVMDRFLGKQRAAEELLHNPPVFKHLAFLARWAGKSRDGNPDIAVALRMLPNVSAVEAFCGSFAPECGTALFAADSQRSREAAIFFANSRDFPSALKALFWGQQLGLFTAPDAAAFRRAVQWIASVFLTVATKLALSARKRLAAFFACERDRWNSDIPSIMLVIADLRAKLAVATSLDSVKGLATMKTGFHLNDLRWLFGGYTNIISGCQCAR